MPTLPRTDGRHNTDYVCSSRRGAPKIDLIHAIGLDSSFWHRQTERLAQDFCVIAYNIVGHGKSSLLSEVVDFGALVDEQRSAIDYAGDNSAHLVDLSLGGMIAQYAAVWMPIQVRSMILIDTAATLSDAVRDAIRGRAEICRTSGMEGILEKSHC